MYLVFLYVESSDTCLIQGIGGSSLFFVSSEDLSLITAELISCFLGVRFCDDFLSSSVSDYQKPGYSSGNHAANNSQHFGNGSETGSFQLPVATFDDPAAQYTHIDPPTLHHTNWGHNQTHYASSGLANDQTSATVYTPSAHNSHHNRNISQSCPPEHNGGEGQYGGRFLLTGYPPQPDAHSGHAASTSGYSQLSACSYQHSPGFSDSYSHQQPTSAYGPPLGAVLELYDPYGLSHQRSTSPCPPAGQSYLHQGPSSNMDPYVLSPSSDPYQETYNTSTPGQYLQQELQQFHSPPYQPPHHYQQQPQNPAVPTQSTSPPTVRRSGMNPRRPPRQNRQILPSRQEPTVLHYQPHNEPKPEHQPSQRQTKQQTQQYQKAQFQQYLQPQSSPGVPLASPARTQTAEQPPRSSFDQAIQSQAHQSVPTEELIPSVSNQAGYPYQFQDGSGPFLPLRNEFERFPGYTVQWKQQNTLNSVYDLLSKAFLEVMSLPYPWKELEREIYAIVEYMSNPST